MWWLIPLTVVGVVGKILHDNFADNPSVTTSQKKPTILDANLTRLGQELQLQKGRKVAILGQPGSGKSTLLLKITSGSVRPRPVIGIHTDATDWSKDQEVQLLSFYNEFVFVDAPGYDTVAHPTSAYLSKFPWENFDSFILVIRGKLHSADEEIYKYISRQRAKICIAKSFSESNDEYDREKIMDDFCNRLTLTNETKIVFFSSKENKGFADIYKAL